jgi:hypothetical protein
MNIWRKIPSGIILFAIYINAIVQLHYSGFSEISFVSKSTTTHCSADFSFNDLLTKVLISDNFNKTENSTSHHPKRVVSDFVIWKSLEFNFARRISRICSESALQTHYKCIVSILLFPFHTFW